MSDLSVGLLRHGYGAIELERRRGGGDTCFEARLLGRRAVVLGGQEGARLFYDEDVVQREGAIPAPLRLLLFGRGAVHGLDDSPHRDRKQIFLDHLGAGRVAQCAELARHDLQQIIGAGSGSQLSVFPMLVQAYGRAVLRWVGVKTSQRRLDELSRSYAAVVAGFGFKPDAYPRAWRARIATDRWATALVRDVRHGRVEATPGTVLRALADADLDGRTAAVELGNVVRPSVAVAWLGTFAVLALAAAGSWREQLADSDAEVLQWSFAQEVRRTTPFVPALAGRVRPAGHTRGDIRLRHGDRVVLDVWGINHDERIHPEPAQFRPDRFVARIPGPYELVPQGGGSPQGHRCPGESLTLQLLVAALQAFAGVDFEVVSPRHAPLTQIPTLPPEGVRISVRMRQRAVG